MNLTRAIEVTPGDKITSRQYRSLARACNDRMRLSKDGPFRVDWLLHNAARQVRNPDTSGLRFPASAEYLEYYATLDPDRCTARWADMPPGEPEGVNLASQIPQYVHGSPDIYSEDIRINDWFPLWRGISPPANLEDVWEISKGQRGAYDPRTTAQNWPEGEAALQFMQVTAPYFSPHGKSYGDYFASPVELLPDCGGSHAGLPSYQIKLTALRADVVVPTHHGTETTVGGMKVITYAGSCPCGSDLCDVGHVQWMTRPYYDSGSYKLWVATACAPCAVALDIFLAMDWVEGPYEGIGQLQHDEGLMIQRMIHLYASSFRGTPVQRVEPFRIKEIAADADAMMKGQHFLSPNIARISGASLVADYPKAEWKAQRYWTGDAPGTFTRNGKTTHGYAAGFVLGVAFAKATGLMLPCSVALWNGAEMIGTLNLKPDGDGNASALVTFPEAVRPNPLRATLPSGARFYTVAGEISVECTEQVAMKPQFWDLALIFRTSATHGSIAGDTMIDAEGRWESEAAKISEDWFAYGCVVNPWAAGVRQIEDTTNDHPVAEAARRFVHGCVRGVRRQQFVAYEVAGGKSILYLHRFSHGDSANEADSFRDIAPPIDPVGSGHLESGVEYVVHGTTGGINYRGRTYLNGERFTATGILEFLEHGDAKCYQYDGIRSTALPGGFLNEWLMYLETQCYNPNETSTFKPSAFADYFYHSDRCLAFADIMPADLLRHISFNYNTELLATYRPGIKVEGDTVWSSMMAPEVASALRYTGGAGSSSNVGAWVTEDFCSSCNVYEKVYEIESCTVDEWGNDPVLKIVLTDRFTAHPDAPATWAKDAPEWSTEEGWPAEIVALEAEDYRTLDNAIRQYHAHVTNPQFQCSYKLGDFAAHNAAEGVFGSCYPKFHFVKLIPEPYEDVPENDTLDESDSRCLVDGYQQLELYLHAQAEGWINSETSEAIICALETPGSLFNYRFEELCVKANGSRSCGAFGLDVRPDKPVGHGPLPNAVMYADCHNRLARAYNLLDRLRLALPLQFKFREQHYWGEKVIPNGWEFFGETECNAGGVWSAHNHNQPPISVAYDSTVDWYYDAGFAASDTQGMLASCPFTLYRRKVDIEFSVDINPVYWHAVPTELQTMITGGEFGALARFDYSSWRGRAHVLDCGDAGVEVCGTSPGTKYHDAAGNCLGFDTGTAVETWSECKLVNAGTFAAPSLPNGDVGTAYDSAGGGVFCVAGGAETWAIVTLLSEAGLYLQFTLANLP